jgi:hypothetical protein
MSKKSVVPFIPDDGVTRLTHDEWLARLNEEPLTPAEVLDRFKIKYNKKHPERRVYELTRRRGNRPPMPSHRVGKLLRFYWSEIRQWQRDVQELRAAA